MTDIRPTSRFAVPKETTVKLEIPSSLPPKCRISSLPPGSLYVDFVSRPEVDGQVWLRCAKPEEDQGDHNLSVRLSDGKVEYRVDQEVLQVALLSPILRYVGEVQTFLVWK